MILLSWTNLLTNRVTIALVRSSLTWAKVVSSKASQMRFRYMTVFYWINEWRWSLLYYSRWCFSILILKPTYNCRVQFMFWMVRNSCCCKKENGNLVNWYACPLWFIVWRLHSYWWTIYDLVILTALSGLWK